MLINIKDTFPSEPTINNVYRKEKSGYNNDYKKSKLWQTYML